MCDTGVAAVMEAAGVAEGTSEGMALEAPRPPAGGGLEQSDVRMVSVICFPWIKCGKWGKVA